MTTQIAVRLSPDELRLLDAEVSAGRASSRSDAVRLGIARLGREARHRSDEKILADLAERGEQVYPDLVGLLDAVAFTLD